MKATEELLKDHKMIRKAMTEWKLENPRFKHLHGTLSRIVRGHAWFEDQLLLPALEKEPAFARRFVDELYQEHKDIEILLKLVEETPTEKDNFKYYVLQLRSLLETHFTKEEQALFPICENVLNAEGLNTMAVEMRKRQHEMREFLDSKQ